MKDGAPTAHLEILDDAECLELLANQPIGRLGLSAAALPVVLPVNYVLDGRTVLFRTEPGLKLDAARANDVACLEVDGFDALDHTGWSVLVTGRMRELTEPDDVGRAAALPLRPWASPLARHVVELSVELVSGRRISQRALPAR